jgi:hypothetical protein
VLYNELPNGVHALLNRHTLLEPAAPPGGGKGDTWGGQLRGDMVEVKGTHSRHMSSGVSQVCWAPFCCRASPGVTRSSAAMGCTGQAGASSGLQANWAWAPLAAPLQLCRHVPKPVHASAVGCCLPHQTL